MTKSKRLPRKYILKRNVLKRLSQLQYFFMCDMWYAKENEWKTEEDMFKYLDGHFDILKSELGILSQEKQSLKFKAKEKK